MSTSSSGPDRFRAVYTDVYDDVLRYVQRRTHEFDRAEDVVADAMLAAWRRIDDLPPDPGDARAWVFGIARNCLLNDSRSARRSDALGVRLAGAVGPARHAAATTSADAPLPTAAIVPDTADEVVARVDLAAAWDRLTDDEQDVLSLTVLDGLTSTQAGAVLGITANAYRLRLTRARAALRRGLQGAASRATAASTREMTS